MYWHSSQTAPARWEKAEFIPTPGQTEQEYLKSFHA